MRNLVFGGNDLSAAHKKSVNEGGIDVIRGPMFIRRLPSAHTWHTHGVVTTMSQPSAHLSGGDGVYLIAKHDFAMSTTNLPLRLTMMKHVQTCVFTCVRGVHSTWRGQRTASAVP